MKPILLDDIPGLKEARASAFLQEADMRRRPFLPVPKVIAGVPLLPLTLRHYVHLEAVQSPFLLHEFGGLGDVLQFLWVLSSDYVFPSPFLRLPDVRKRRAKFLQAIYPRAKRCILGKTCRRIRAYVEEAIFECPKGRRGADDRPPIAHLAASIIDEFAQYSWPDEVLDDHGQPDRRNPGTFDKPLARLLQYRRCRIVRLAPGVELPNPLSDGVDRVFLAKFNAREAKRAARKARKT